MQNIKLCVFDMAGTTVNEDNLVYKTVQQAIEKAGVAVTLDECLANGAGKEKRQAIADILLAKHISGNLEKDIDIENTTNIAFETFKLLLENAYHEGTIQAFDGMDDLFQTLRAKGIKVVLNTGYNRLTAEKIISLIGWEVGVDIDALVTADDVSNGRPCPDMIQLAMRQTRVVDSKQVLKAGDSVIDIEEGKNAGCGLTIGVLSGAQTREQLNVAKPDQVIDLLTDLIDEL